MEQSTSVRRTVCGGTKEVNPMKLVSWIIFAGVVWFLLPFIVPMAILYVIVRFLNVVLVGKAVQEAHHDR